MARKKQTDSAFVMFDVFYEDGTRSSNRRIPTADLGGLDGDSPARDMIEAQDKKIAEMSGRPRAAIKTISRTATR